MFDLFEEENCLVKIKEDSKASQRKVKSLFKQMNRDENCIDALKNIGGLPKDNEVISFVSKGMSDAGSFINAVLAENEIINEAVIATWTISKKNIEKLLQLLDDGKIESLFFLINDGIIKTNSTKSIYAFMILEFQKRNDKVKYLVANSHAKIQCYKCNDNYYTISGSGNWSENPRIENYILIGGIETFKFNKEWMIKP